LKCLACFPDPTSLSQTRGSALARPIAGDHSFWFEGDRLEIPSFENAEGLISGLTRRSALVRDEIVAGIADGDPRASSERSVQRHFQLSMGVTAKHFEQIRRARRAVDLLQRGVPVVSVASELGYSDQAHMTREWNALAGCSPRAWIARELPFLQDYELGGRDNGSVDFESLHQSFV